ncbi:YqcI/YcgG family protein [Amycolatopsis sp. NBC_01286]|uniref:YqcI/YcgG family protein n=1 Tax=Amycolatopsis sp. NBC_01286 TaxID=2903560 RepID=UPI002E145DD0|nr:YqcI/YcgG family protein [Amycolatopsis sp. NBC_01286]
MNKSNERTRLISQTRAGEDADGWHRAVLDDVESRLADPEFPCVFSRNAFKKRLVKFIFVEHRGRREIRRLGEGLRDYVELSRAWDGRLDTAYPLVVAFSREAVAARTVDDYHTFGWKILQELHEIDPAPWPDDIGRDPRSGAWSMCFDGMPLFCNMSSPAHRVRRSRNLGGHFILVINPRERFDVFAGDTPSGRKVRSNIRDRIGRYDGIPHSWQLGSYGAGALEWCQYGLVEDNIERVDKCPFEFGGGARPADVIKKSEGDLSMIEIIVSQGRIGDRAPGMLEGAERTAHALEQRYDAKGQYVGRPGAPVDDDWSVSLPAAGETLTALGQAVSASITADHRTVMVANTCAASLASLPVVAREHPDCLVLWIDAHGDFNTPETTGSGYLGGMALSGACGLWDSGHGAGLDPRQVILIGARDIDAAERVLLDEAGVRIIPPAEATARRVAQAVNGSRVWVHIDWDVLEPGYVPADYQVPDGLLPNQIRAILESIPASDVLGIELAEFTATPGEGTDGGAVDSIMDMVAPVFETVADR